MAELQLIPTITSVTVISGIISIKNFFVLGQGDNNIISSEWKAATGTQEGTPFTEGDLVMVVKNHLAPLNVYLNSIGELIIDDDNASQYQINSGGSLEFVE